MTELLLNGIDVPPKKILKVLTYYNVTSNLEKKNFNTRVIKSSHYIDLPKRTLFQIINM